MPHPMSHTPALPWLNPGDAFPDVRQAWPAESDAPGLLAAGGSLDVASLVSAYSQGIFPWYSQGQPVLWWSTDPRMVLDVAHFRLHRSLRKTMLRFQAQGNCQIRVDSNFAAVIDHCARTVRGAQAGTWILPDMKRAYQALHAAGMAHSVETWVNGELVGGLYCVALGQAVFGESMFALHSDASKLALAALVCMCRAHGIRFIDCQQNTRHLASLGAAEMPRAEFVAYVREAILRPAPQWQFDALYWAHLLDT